MTQDAAVTAAAEALEAHYASGYFCRCGVEVNSVSTHMAAAAVAAARPIIEAEAYRRALDVIEAERKDETVVLTDAGLVFAADAVRVLLNAARGGAS